MFKKATCILLTIILITSFVTFQATAQEQNIVVKIDGEVVEFPDAKPFIDEQSRTLCPIRFIAENLGAEVLWNNEDKRYQLRKMILISC